MCEIDMSEYFQVYNTNQEPPELCRGRWVFEVVTEEGVRVIHHAAEGTCWKDAKKNLPLGYPGAKSIKLRL